MIAVQVREVNVDSFQSIPGHDEGMTYFPYQKVPPYQVLLSFVTERSTTYDVRQSVVTFIPT